MSDGRDKRPGDEDENVEQEKTLVRGTTPSVTEPNDDATIVRKSASDDRHVPNDDVTHLKEPAPAEAEPDDNETIVRGLSGDPSTPSSKNDNATIVRGETADGGVSSPGGEATILKGPSDGEATILKGPGSDSATILREPGDGTDEATVVRNDGGRQEPGRRSPPLSDDDATVIGGTISEDATIISGNADDEATIIGRPGEDDDRTVIGDNPGDDATVMGADGSDQDTTYIASVGQQIRPQGNSEAGRLLKNRFVLEEKIGSGGMGDVYKALDLRQQEAQERDPYIAIKLLNENFSRHKDAFLSLQRETSRTRGIPHPNIMAVYDFDREGDTVFMSMELLDGKPLDDYLKEHPEGVSPEDAWTIIDGISQGLQRAHNAGIVHSDFKPGNIFYTKDKSAKVFDFGIARAISNPNEIEADGEKTVFDAGTLGALTPTYASYEMLTGLEPSKSDDVYAVALVAYELFMGKHPYDRVPADKALERGMTPKPVPFLKRRHWKALKKALALKGEDRTQSMEEFREGMFSEDPPYFRYAAIATVILGSMGFATWQAFNVKEKPEDLLAYEDVKAASLATLRAAETTQDWDSDVWHDRVAEAVSQWRLANDNIQVNEAWVEDFELDTTETVLQEWVGNVAAVYLGKIEDLRGEAIQYSPDRHEQFGVEQARDKLLEAQRYLDRVAVAFKSGDPDRFLKESQAVTVRLQLRQEALASIEAQEIADEKARIAAAEAAEKERLRVEFETARLASYNGYLNELKEILKCKGDMSVTQQERLGFLLSSMKTEWEEAYSYHYPTVVEYLTTCIQQRIGYAKPELARQVKARVVSYLPGEPRIANLVIEDLDPCADRKLEGRGNMNRNWCSDPLSEGGNGPQLVVIPKRDETRPKYAISRSEIKVAEYNQYCSNTGCAEIPGGQGLPATNISFQQAVAYADWLTAQTGETYRLPKVDEWRYAAETNKAEPIDENINCTVDSRGVRLGEKLLNVVSGRSNSFGLFNFVGNAREWAVASGNDLLALGGAHTDPRAQCTLQKQVPHQGEPDPVTGFRLVREIHLKDDTIPTGEVAASGGG
jgi:serine/threonine protein kinase